MISKAELVQKWEAKLVERPLTQCREESAAVSSLKVCHATTASQTSSGTYAATDDPSACIAHGLTLTLNSADQMCFMF